MHNLDARRARRLVFAQLLVTLVVVLLAALIDLRTARDALAGGVAACAGSMAFAAWVFGPYRAQEPGRMVARFYSGEIIKLLVVVAVFAVTMKGLDTLDPVALFGAFLIVQVLPPLLANWIVD